MIETDIKIMLIFLKRLEFQCYQVLQQKITGTYFLNFLATTCRVHPNQQVHHTD